MSVGSTASAAARRLCPGSSASAQPSPARASTLATTSVPTPALIPSRTSSSTGAVRASGRITSGSRSSRCRTPAWVPDTRPGSSPVCAASAAANAMSCAARLARTAARTAASPAPRSGSLTPGAASLTAESTQASLSPCRPTSACRDAWPAAELAGQPARQPHRGVERRRPRVAVREPVRGHRDPGPLDAGQGVGGNPRQVGVCWRARPRRRRAARPPATRTGGSARRAAGPSRRPGRRPGWRPAVRRRGRASPGRCRGPRDPGASRRRRPPTPRPRTAAPARPGRRRRTGAPA